MRMTHVRSPADILNVVDREADKDSIEERTVKRMGLVSRKLARDVPGFENDWVSADDHLEVIIAIMS
jgi:hypothetical protein